MGAGLELGMVGSIFCGRCGPVRLGAQKKDSVLQEVKRLEAGDCIIV